MAQSKNISTEDFSRLPRLWYSIGTYFIDLQKNLELGRIRTNKG